MAIRAIFIILLMQYLYITLSIQRGESSWSPQITLLFGSDAASGKKYHKYFDILRKSLTYFLLSKFFVRWSHVLELNPALGFFRWTSIYISNATLSLSLRPLHRLRGVFPLHPTGQITAQVWIEVQIQPRVGAFTIRCHSIVFWTSQ